MKHISNLRASAHGWGRALRSLGVAGLALITCVAFAQVSIPWTDIDIPGNTSTTMALLTQTGDGTNAGAPVWTPTSGLQIIFRQGSDAERQTVVFASGEAVWTTDTQQIYIGDGVTLGGLLSSVGSGNIPVAGQLSITYTGKPLVPLLLPLVPASVIVPAVPAAGEVIYSASPVPAIAGFTYSEDYFPGYLTSLAFNNLALITGSFSPTKMAGLTTLALPELVTVSGIFNPSYLTSLTTLSLPTLVAVGGSFAPAYIESLTTLSVPELTVCGGFNPYSMASLTTLSAPKLTTVSGAFSPGSMAALTTLSVPELVTVSGDFNPNSMAAMITFSAPKLVTVYGSVSLSVMASLTTLAFPELTTVGNNFSPSSMASLTTLSAPKLVTVVGDCKPANYSASLTTISLPELTTIGKTFAPATMASLTTISLPKMVSYGSTISVPSASIANVSSVTLGTVGTLKAISGATITLSGLKIPSANVNAILALLVSLNGTNGTTTWGTGKTLLINGGTNGAPTGQGATDKATLQGRGATVTTN